MSKSHQKIMKFKSHYSGEKREGEESERENVNIVNKMKKENAMKRK